MKGIQKQEELLVEKSVLSKMWVLRRVLMPMGTSDGLEFLIDKLKQSKSKPMLRPRKSAPTPKPTSTATTSR